MRTATSYSSGMGSRARCLRFGVHQPTLEGLGVPQAGKKSMIHIRGSASEKLEFNSSASKGLPRKHQDLSLNP